MEMKKKTTTTLEAEKKIILGIAGRYLAIGFERVCSILSIAGFVVGTLYQLNGFQWTILLGQITAVLLSIMCYKATLIDSLRLEREVIRFKKTLTTPQAMQEQKTSAKTSEQTPKTKAKTHTKEASVNA